MTEKGSNVSLWAAALQDHYFTHGTNSPNISKSVTRQREKWERENRRRQQQLGQIHNGVRLPKLSSVSATPSDRTVNRVKSLIQLGPDIVLDKPPKVTLAQKLGLLETPRQPLPASEWQNIKQKAHTTHAAYRTDCAICHEPFAAYSQVILSCSHSFHRACIAAYERHTKSKRCPLCRCSDYQMLATSDAARVFYEDAAVRIQAAWRGWQCRKRYLRYRADNVPRHPLLKKKYHMNRLNELSAALDSQVRSDTDEIDALFREMDLSMQASRDAFKKFEEVYREPIDWDVVFEGIYRRRAQPLEEACSICLCDLSEFIERGSFAKAVGGRKPKQRKVSVLSCGHLLHHSCISSFEKFKSEGAKNVCPVCRSEYERTLYPM
ncbi:hypothetical protein BC830DRAFT_1126327 [Chytriomyces sp. MP71]|nr:hypothetical protein BC830DRAFT_1126327 [Chytriomyces sp. MP71]